MKYLKIQQDLLKAVEARDQKHKPFNYPWFEMDESIFICPGGHYIVRIPCVFWYLDKDKIFNTPPINGKSFIENFYDLDEATDTHITQDVIADDNKKKLHMFTVGDESVLLDEVNLKYFDLADSQFRGTNRRNPIYIYEDETLVGMVLSVIHNEAS